MSNSEFTNKLKKLRENNPDISIQEDAKLELLLCLKSSIDTLNSQNALEDMLQKQMMTRLLDQNPDTQMSVGQMVQLYQIIKKTKSDDLASILGVLKQQTIVQQNNEISIPSFNKSNTEKEINQPPSREEMEKARQILEFVEMLKSAHIDGNGDPDN